MPSDVKSNAKAPAASKQSSKPAPNQKQTAAIETIEPLSSLGFPAGNRPITPRQALQLQQVVGNKSVRKLINPQNVNSIQRLITRAQFVTSTQPKIGRRGVHNANLYNRVEPLLDLYNDPNNPPNRQTRMEILYRIEHAIYDWVRNKPHLARDSARRQPVMALLEDVQAEHQAQVAQVSATGPAGPANVLHVGDPNLTPAQHAQIQQLWDSLRNNAGVIEITETAAQTPGMPPENVPGFRNQMLALFARLLSSQTGRTLIDELLAGKVGGAGAAAAAVGPVPAGDKVTVRPLRAAEIAMGRTVGAAGVKQFGQERMKTDGTRRAGVGSYVTYGRNLTESQVEGRLMNGDPLLTPVFIGFGHELIHALHNLRGVNQNKMPMNAADQGIWSNAEERATIEAVAGPGAPAIPGIPGVITENQLRDEHGLTPRDSHH